MSFPYVLDLAFGSEQATCGDVSFAPKMEVKETQEDNGGDNVPHQPLPEEPVLDPGSLVNPY